MAITVATAAPTFKPHATAEISGGDYNYFQAKGSVLGPLLEDQLAGRLSLATTTRRGYLTNIDGQGPNFSGGANNVNAYRNLTLRGQLLYTPTEDFSLRAITDYSNQSTNCCSEVLYKIVAPPNGKNYVNYAAAFGYTPTIDPFARRADTNAPIFARQETGGVSVQADWRLPKLTLTSITAFRFWNWWPSNDGDYSPLSVLNYAQNGDYQNQFSQELRVASAGDNRVDYVGGLYVYRERIDAVARTQYGSAASYFLLGPAAPASELDGFNLQSTPTFNPPAWRPSVRRSGM